MNYKIIEHGTVYAKESLFGYAAWPTVAKTQDGTLLVACSAFRVGHICPFGKTALMKSTDEGKTWSEPMPVIDTPLDDRDGGLCVFNDKVMVTSFNNSVDFQKKRISPDTKDKKGLLRLAYCECLDVAEAEKSLGSTYRISEDGGNTFGQMGILPITSPHGPCRLQDGRLFYLGRAFSSPGLNPQYLYRHSNQHMRFGEYDALMDGLYYMFSDDEGKSWTSPKELPYLESIWTNGRFCCEPHAVQLKNGRILAHIRVEKNEPDGMFSTYQCYSDDSGKTFSKPVMVIEKGAPSHLAQLSDGTVVCTFGYRSAPFGQRAKYSADNGESWSEDIILRDDGENWDLGYPSTVELANGDLFTVYYQRPSNCKNTGIYYTKWKIER